MLYTLSDAPLILSPAGQKTVTQGQRVMLPCQHEGYPKPTVTWFNTDHNYTVQHDGAAFIIYSNGSLLIKSAESWQEGVYLCVVENVKGKTNITQDLRILGLYY